MKDRNRDFDLVCSIEQGVQRDQLAMALLNTLKRYGATSEQLARHGTPQALVTSERYTSKHADRLVCGTYAGGSDFTLYSPGFAWRRSMGYSVKLSVLEAYIHETLHAVSGRKVVKGTYIDNDMSLETAREIGGYHEYIVMDRHRHSFAHELLNEGVTQTLTQDVMFEYLFLDPFLDVTSEDVERHYVKNALGDEGAFYPAAVSFIQALIERLRRDTSEEESRSFVFQGYFAGTSLLNDPTWITRLDAAACLGVIHKARVASMDQLPILDQMLRKEPDAWDGLLIIKEEQEL